MTRSEVLVVGAGVMGACTAWSLARRGRDVVLLEQFQVGHTRGSSHGVSRIFRYSYREARYVRMAMESVPLWRRLEEESGRTLLRRTGGLDVGALAMSDHAPALEEAGAAFEVIDGSEARRRFPFMAIEDEEPALYQPDAGIAMADDTVAAAASCATRRGVSVIEGMRVRSLEADAGAVRVVAGDAVHESRVAVVAAGGWARSLLATAGIDLSVTPTLETVAFFRTPDEERLVPFIDWRDPPFYSLPSPGQGLKVGEFRVGPPTDPDSTGSPGDQTMRNMSDWVRARFPGADPDPQSADTCIYTNTVDEDFILERHGPLVVGSPCSGHGFKFAPWIGERLADLAEEGLEAS